MEQVVVGLFLLTGLGLFIPGWEGGGSHPIPGLLPVDMQYSHCAPPVYLTPPYSTREPQAMPATTICY